MAVDPARNDAPSIVRNYLYSSLTTVLNVLIPLVTYPYVARVLGPVNMGRLGIGGSLANYFIVAAGMGMPIYGVRAIAMAKSDAGKLSRSVTELYLLSLMGASIATAGFFLAVHLVPQYRDDALLLSVFGSTIFATVAGMEWFFQGIEEFRYIGIRNVVVQVGFVAALFLLVRSDTDVVSYALIFAATLFVSIAVNVRSAFAFVRPNFRNIQPFRHLPSMLVLALMSFAITAYTNLDLLFLGLLSAPEQAGFYIISLRIARMVVTVSATLSAVLLPRLSALAVSDTGEFERVLSRSLKAILLFTLPAAAGVIAVSEDVVLLFAGGAFSASVHSLRITAWMIPAVGLSNFLQMQVLVPKGKERRMLVSFGVAAATGGALCWLLVPSLGHLGAAIGMLSAELAVLVSHAVICGRKQLASIVDRGAIARYATGAIGCGLVALLPSVFAEPGVFRLLVSIALGAGTYLAFLLVLNDTLVREALDRLAGKMDRKRMPR